MKSLLHFTLKTMMAMVMGIGLVALSALPASAQVSYSETWDVAFSLEGWTNGAGTGGTFSQFSDGTSCDGNGSVRANQWSAGHSREFISPQTGISNGALPTLTFDYKYAIWSANTVGAAATSFTLEVFWGTSASGPWNSLGVINSGNHTVSGSCAPGPGTYTFTPSNGDPVYIRFLSTRLGEDYYVNYDNVVVQEELPICTAVPTPGNTVSSSALTCPGANFTLSLQNPTAGSGISYQWQTSPDNSTWTNAGPDAATWETTQTEDTYYQCIVTCDGEGSATSTSILVEIDTPANCLCEPTYTFGKTDGDLISNVVITGTTLSNNTGTDPVNPAYTYFNTLPNHTGDLQAGTTYNIEVSIGSFTNQNIAVWIDFNEDGVFDISERVGFAGPVNTAFGTVSFPISLPCDPVPGVKRMRVRDVWNLAPNTIDPCATYGFGETEDYDVTILPPPACPTPNGLVASNETASSVDLDWNQGCTETAWEIEYGAPGFTIGDGTTVPAGTNEAFTLGGLDDDTTYDVYVRADCDVDGLSTEFGPISVVTLPLPPACATNLQATPGACDNVDLLFSWDAAASATGYLFSLGTTPGGNEIADNQNLGNVLSFNFATPTTETDYYWTVTPFNVAGNAVGCAEQMYTTGSVGCVCEPAYDFGKTDGDLISNVVITGTTLSNNTGTDPVNPAYTYFNTLPNHTGDLQAGTTYNIEVSIGSFTNQNIAVWIDFNEDNSFDLSERVGFAGPVNTAFGTVSFPISLPCDPVPGVKRMRVRDVWNLAPNLIDPCATYGFGETEDYDVTILPPPPCPSPIGLVVADLGTDNALIDWNTGCSETEWEVEYGAPGFTLGDGTIETVTDSEFLFENLGAGESIEVYVRAVCDEDLSAPIGPVSFTTPPVGDLCSDAIDAGTLGDNDSYTTTGSNVGTSVETDIWGPEVLGDIYYTFELTEDCNFLNINGCGASPALVNATIVVFTVCPDDPGFDIANDVVFGDFDFDACGDGNFSVFFQEIPAGVYYYPILRDTEPGLDYNLEIVTTPCIDDCANDFSASPNLPLPDLATTTHDIVVGPQVGGDIITDMDVQIGLTHSFMGDLTITLTSPCGTEVLLYNGECGATADMVAIFDDNATDEFALWCTYRYGSVIPEEALSAFNNSSIEGTWTLSITDDASGDTGTLLNWCLNPVLEDLCVAPQVAINSFTDTTIEVDLVEGCFDPANYDSFTINWGTGSQSGITSLPYTIEDLDPGTNYTIELSAVCPGPNPSGATTISQYTLNCTTEEVCTYTLTLANSSGTGFDGAFVQVNNGWFTADYTLGATEEENTFIIDACPGSPLSVNLTNGGNGGLGGQYSVSLVNASDVEVYGASGPPEALLFETEDGCPDCASVQNISFTRLASDQVDVTWSNVELVGNVDDILVEVFTLDFLGEPTQLVGSSTESAGSTSASIVLDSEYPFEEILVRVSTNCTGDAIGEASTSAFLPECAAAAQCEYVFDMTSAADGWGDFGLDILLGDYVDFTLALETGTSGTQSVFACEFENLEVSANSPGGTPAGCLVAVNGLWQTLSPICGGGPASVTNAWTGEYSNVNVVAGNEYTFSSTDNGDSAPNFITVSNAAGTVVLAAGTSPITWYAESAGTVRFYSHNEGPDDCGGDTGGFRTRSVSCASAPAPVSCSSIGFDLTLNPATDNVELIATTDFCDYEDGETVFSGSTCPSCFSATAVQALNATTNSVDVSWNSPNPAGTDYTVYVGLPGFTPGVDDVASVAGTTAATGAQGPETVGGLDLDTDYEVIIIEDCGAEQADATLPVLFSTLPPSPCPLFEVPAGATAEGEPCGDDINGGCNSPNPAFGTIDCGETVVGNGWADGGTRDTDWYQFVTTEGGEIDIVASAEFPFVVGVIFDFDDCSSISTFDLFVLGDACTEVNLNGIVGPGIHTVFVGHQLFEGTPCGINANSYWVTLDADICTPIVEPDNNECNTPDPLSVVQWPANSFTLGTLQGATASPAGPFCEGLATRDVFYSFNAATDNHYFVNINPIAGTDFTVELYDECDGELIECMSFSSEIGGCGAAQTTAGFPSDPDCEEAVCTQDPFCCNSTWDGICAGIASGAQSAACVDCLEFIPSPAELILDLPAGDYVLRVGSALGLPLLGADAQFLIGVQSFPTAQVQDDPGNFLYACNQTVQLEDIIGATPQSGQLPGVLDYEWFIAEEGGTFQNFWVRGGPNYATLPQWLDMEYAGITYNVFVRLLIDVPGVGPTWGVFQQLNPDPHAVGASVCTITTSNDITLTELRPNYVGTNAQGNPYAMCDIAIAQTVAEAEAYEWWFSSIAGDVYYVRNAPNPSIKLSWVDCLQPNSFYDVRVRAQVGGVWANFGPVQTIETGPTALTQLRDNLCGDEVQLTTWLLPTSVCISDSHTWELENTVTNDIHTFVSINPSGAARVNQFVPPVVPGQEYIVRVKATQCTVEGDFSAECNITIAGPGAEEQGTPLLRDLATNGSSLYPNPNAGSEVRLELQGIGEGAHDVHVVIYDIYGKMINTNNFGHEGTDLSRLIRFDENLAMGMYMVHVLIDGEQFAVERMVVK